MMSPEIVSRADWLAAHEALMAKEKAMTRAGDALAADRRRHPWELVEKDYELVGPDGRLSLSDAFEGRRQLILYHHMLKKDDPAPCSGCGMFTDNVAGNLVHLNQRDTTFAIVAQAPIDQIEALKTRLVWTMPFYSTSGDINRDFCGGYFGLNVFIKHEGRMYRTYYTTDRGVEKLGTSWTFLDLTPLGRQEKWEDSPEGVPQTDPFRWWRLNDEYVAEKKARACCAAE